MNTIKSSTLAVCLVWLVALSYASSESPISYNSGRLQSSGTHQEDIGFNLRPSLGKILIELGNLKKVNLTGIITNVAGIVTECLLGADMTEFECQPSEYTSKIDYQDETRHEQESISTVSSWISDRFENYCNTKDFREIHDQIWNKDKQLKDLMKFMMKFGIPDAYEIAKKLYTDSNCPEDLIEDLTEDESKNFRLSQHPKLFPNIREQFLQTQSPTPMPNALKPVIDCILCKLGEMNKAGIFELTSFFNVLLKELRTEPALHFLIGKAGEPAKKQSFRDFRLLIPVRDLSKAMHKAIIANDDIRPVLELVKETLQLDLINVNIIETVFNLMEMILWQNYEPVPPYV